jgi:hypothetical protein
MKNARIILESLVIVGYAIGLFPMMYLLIACWFVIPLTLVNFVLSVPSKRILVNLVNIVMAFLSFIPLFGLFARIAGIVLSAIAITNLTNENNKWDTDTDQDCYK